MPRLESMKIAEALKSGVPMNGAPYYGDSQGLEQPAFDPISILAMLGPSVARSGATMMRGMPEVAEQIPMMLRGETGAVRIGVPRQIVSGDPIRPHELLTDAERQYKLWESTEKQYLHNNDFKNALRAKWGMLKNAGGN